MNDFENKTHEDLQREKSQLEACLSIGENNDYGCGSELLAREKIQQLEAILAERKK